MSLQRNYYEVLGIPPGATTDQIKKKYRELARKFHPDVVQDKVLGQRVFSQINQAYRVLADPERREQYNSQLAATASAPSTPAAQPAPRPSAARRAGKRDQPSGLRPTGRDRRDRSRPQRRPPNRRGPASTANGLSRRARTRHGRPPRPRTAGRRAEDAGRGRAAANADNAIMAGKPIEARAFCIKVLEIDPRNVRALEILGDALVAMGKREDAAVQYRNALAIASSSLIQSKLDRLEQAATPTRTNPPGGRGTSRRQARRSARAVPGPQVGSGSRGYKHAARQRHVLKGRKTSTTADEGGEFDSPPFVRLGLQKEGDDAGGVADGSPARAGRLPPDRA